MMILKPSAKKLLALALLALSMAALCYSIEPLLNKITAGTEIIKTYESVFFLLLAIYFLLQLVPGFAVLYIDQQGFREIWFFRQRIQVRWSEVDFSDSKETQKGDSLYLKHKNEQLLSRKVALKGTYAQSIPMLYQQFVQYAQEAHGEASQKYYFSLYSIQKTLWIISLILFCVFNGFYLNVGKDYPKFTQQLQNWRLQGETAEQLFERLKPLGLAWKPALKQLDRKLYLQVLGVESSQLEVFLVKRYQRQNQPSDKVLEDFKADIKLCRDKFLWQDENQYFHCLEQL